MTTDLQLCIEKNYLEIWTRYKMMFFKVFNSILTDMKYRIWQAEDEWLSFCYEKTIQAVDSIKPEKVKHPDTWTIYTQLNRYVFTYALREIEKEYHNNAYSLDSFIEENDYDENAALKTEDQHEVDMDMFTPEEKEFIEYMQNHTTYKGKYTQYAYKKFKKSITAKLLN